MSLSCILRNCWKQSATHYLKKAVVLNQLKPVSYTTNIKKIEPVSTRLNDIYSNHFSQLSGVKHFGTSPVSRSAHGDHSKIWTAERLMSGAMLIVLPAALMMPSQALDALMALCITMHMHWGIEAVVVDYVRPIIFGPLIPKVGIMLVYVLSIATLAGLLNFIFNDVGLANGIRLLWKL